MPDDTVTLGLDGDVTLADFQTAVSAFNGLLLELGNTVAPDAPVTWVVERLDTSSAIMTARGESRSAANVERVTQAFLTVGRSLSTRELIPYPARVAGFASQIANLIDGRIPSVTFETAVETNVITAPSPTLIAIAPERPIVARGAVEGLVQTVSNRRGLRFTLYDSVFDKAVSCYLREGQENEMRDVWGKRAVVEGTVTRDRPTGRPRSVRAITRVELLVERTPGAYRRARGASVSGDELPEDAVRRLRDAE